MFGRYFRALSVALTLFVPFAVVTGFTESNGLVRCD